jgi:sialate O-acetylesterase
MTSVYGISETFFSKAVYTAITSLALQGCMYSQSVNHPGLGPVPNTGHDLSLNPLFGNGAVIQRGEIIPFRGKAPAGTYVHVSMGGKEKEATADKDGTWLAKLGPFKAGEPYNLNVSAIGQETITSSIRAGDVFLCSGQSNMEWNLKEANETQEISAAHDPDTHLFHIPVTPTGKPQKDFAENIQWSSVTPESVSGFSAACYFAAKELRRGGIDTPIGLIEAARGGSAMQAWLGDKTLTSLPFDASRKPDQRDGNSALYNGMIAPLAPFPVKGIYWYQGESNANDPASSAFMLPAMIGEWRQDLQSPDAPFFIVQLPNYKQGRDWPAFREVQKRTAETTPNTTLIVTIDTADDPGDLHPRDKRKVGARLAAATLGEIYKKNVEYSGPVPRSAEVVGDQIFVGFDHVQKGLTTRDGSSAVDEFTLCAREQACTPISGSIKRNQIFFSYSADTKFPAKICYAQSGAPEGNLLFNKDGLPAGPFCMELE